MSCGVITVSLRRFGTHWNSGFAVFRNGFRKLELRRQGSFDVALRASVLGNLEVSNLVYSSRPEKEQADAGRQNEVF